MAPPRPVVRRRRAARRDGRRWDDKVTARRAGGEGTVRGPVLRARRAAARHLSTPGDDAQVDRARRRRPGARAGQQRPRPRGPGARSTRTGTPRSRPAAASPSASSRSCSAWSRSRFAISLPFPDVPTPTCPVCRSIPWPDRPELPRPARTAGSRTGLAGCWTRPKYVWPVVARLRPGPRRDQRRRDPRTQTGCRGAENQAEGPRRRAMLGG